MLVRLFFIFILFNLFAEVNAQDKSYKAWIEVQTENDLNKIEARFVNQTSEEKEFLYKLKLTKSGSSSSSNTQSGTFTASSGKDMSLSSAQINTTAQDYFKALLLVYQEGKLVARDSFEQGTKPIKSPISKEKKQTPWSGDNLEIDGIIIDETRSKTARDFYDVFYSKWLAPANAKDYSIRIKELPSRGRGARITVEVNDRALYTRVLQPKLEVIEQLAIQAIGIIRQHLNKNESLKRELGSEDQRGSGLY